MRPSLLDPLFAALTRLPGVGPKLEKLYRTAVRPRGHAGARDRSAVPPADRHDRPAGAAETARRGAGLGCNRRGHGREPPAPPPQPAAPPYRIETCDETGTLTLTYFHAKRDYLEKLFPAGELRYVSGTAELYDGMLQMVHPDRVVSEAELDKLPMVEPVYPLTEGLALNPVRKAAEAALTQIPELPEWQDEAWLSARRFPSFAGALHTLHRPAEPADILPESRPGRGSPMTSCSRDSSRWRWFARTSASCRAAAARARAYCAPRWSRPCPIR